MVNKKQQEEEIKECPGKLSIFDLTCGQTGYYDSLEDNLDDIKITEHNITTIVKKINEIIDFINIDN